MSQDDSEEEIWGYRSRLKRQHRPEQADGEGGADSSPPPSQAKGKARGRKATTPKGKGRTATKSPGRSPRGRRSGDETTPKRVVHEGFCPNCQMPFSLLLVQSPRWHMAECMEQPIQAVEECPAGLSCDCTIPSHYRRFHHTLLAMGRAGLPGTDLQDADLMPPQGDEVSQEDHDSRDTAVSSVSSASTTQGSGKKRELSVNSVTSLKRMKKGSILEVETVTDAQDEQRKGAFFSSKVTVSSEDFVVKGKRETSKAQSKQGVSEVKSRHFQVSIKSGSNPVKSDHQPLPKLPNMSTKGLGIRRQRLEPLMPEDKTSDQKKVNSTQDFVQKAEETDEAGDENVDHESLSDIDMFGEDSTEDAPQTNNPAWPSQEESESCSEEDIFACKDGGEDPIKEEECGDKNGIPEFDVDLDDLVQEMSDWRDGGSDGDDGDEEKEEEDKDSDYVVGGSQSSVNTAIQTMSSLAQTSSQGEVATKKQSRIFSFFKPVSGSTVPKSAQGKPEVKHSVQGGRISQSDSTRSVGTSQTGAASQMGRTSNWNGGATFSYPRGDTQGAPASKQCPFYKKIPGTTFVVDAFRYGTIPGCSAYFLSHFHYDHYQGLRKHFRHAIYSSKVTCNLVKKKIRVADRYLHPLPLDTPCDVEGVKVTLLEANHCPGAVMFLFQLPDGKNLLHTGDFRADSSMECYPALAGCKVHTIYLDTTYCNPAYSFPGQMDVIDFAVGVAVEAVQQNPKTLIVCGSYTIGKERVFFAVAEALGCKVCVARDKKNTLDCLESDQVKRLVTLNGRETRLHVLPMKDLKFNSLKSYLEGYKPQYDSVLAFEPTGWTHNNSVSTVANIRPKRHGNITVYGIPYSEHSSFTEMKRFVQFLRPAKILPTVNNGSPKSRRAMEQIFQQWSSEGRQQSMASWVK
ncbi:uncharacterized protein [Branchiostoma lanceolatum]|uniref:uncharacterized protein isoform X2 n=1 Tax=Branchiostoma lanceolatum TaxID=7740 RepID=UPI0034558394